jgi:hypothetical protein
LHVPEGEKIPAKKMAQAAKSDNPRMKRMVSLARTLKGMPHKADGGSVKGDKYAPVRAEGVARLRTKFGQEDAPKWSKAEGDDARLTAGLVRKQPAFAGPD